MKISFDVNSIPEQPTFVLAHKNGRKIGQLLTEQNVIRSSMTNPAEMSFRVYKFINRKKNYLWDKIVDFKLVWCKEADMWFEATVEIDESDETIKHVTCTQLGQAELSQILLYGVEINTETDISRDDYSIPTILWNPENPDASLLHRIMEKAPHYTVIHVDDTIAKIQRTFSFDNVSIHDAFNQIAEEVGCLFIYHSNSDDKGRIQRTISVYDLEATCNTCGYRGEFTLECPECESNDINEGYGNDTNVFITADELAENIRFTSDTGAIKNCFKLEAGDDLMTATIRNCNPNGTSYIWYISDSVKEDMSEELVHSLNSYDDLYEFYYNTHEIGIDATGYNSLVQKYQIFNDELEQIQSPIIGYPSLMTAYYQVTDFALYLESSLMPDSSMDDTDAEEQAALLTVTNLSPVAVSDISKISHATADSMVLSVAKVLIDSRYKVKVNTSTLTDNVWEGNFTVTNYSDDEDTAISPMVKLIITDNYEEFVRQKLEKAIKEKETDEFSIGGLFELEYDTFCSEIEKYCLHSLNSFHDACQACIDILIDQGIADIDAWNTSGTNLYDAIYLPYYEKLQALEAEIQLREEEITIVNDLETLILLNKSDIQEALDFEAYLGRELWLEFVSYRRDDTYSNENFISDGLTNSELFQKATEFIEQARTEIYKSAELQHSISSTLKNLLVIQKFRPFIQHFEVGNWIRIQVDDNVYKLRLLEYEVDYDDLDSLSVEFSDVIKGSDKKSLIDKTKSIASSYNATQRQAKQGYESNKIIQEWNDNGFDATNNQIIGGADNQTQTWDSHGMLFRKYDVMTGDYEPIQLKIINSTIAITNDNWKTTKTAIGNFYYRDPISGKLKNAYGINGEIIIGKLLLGEQLGVYNRAGNLSFDEDGLAVTNGTNTVTINPNASSIISIQNNDNNIFAFDEDGDLFIIGNITATSLTLMDGTMIESEHISGLSTVAISGNYSDLKDTPVLATVATTGNYSDLTGTPELAKVATTGSYLDLSDTVDFDSKLDVPSNNVSGIAGQFLSKTANGSTWKSAAISITEDGTDPVSGTAVYEYALSKTQSDADIGKIFIIGEDKVVTTISIEDLKTLLSA